MLNTYTVSFFGHRHLENPITVERKLEMLISSLLREKEYIEFLVGRDGDFDLLVSSVIRRCKRIIRNDNSSLVWVMPYLTAEYRNNEVSFLDYYDEIELCSVSAKSHYKAAFRLRNREMIDRSDLVVLCAQHRTGGSYQALLYAQQQAKRIIKLCPLGVSEEYL